MRLVLSARICEFTPFQSIARDGDMRIYVYERRRIVCVRFSSYRERVVVFSYGCAFTPFLSIVRDSICDSTSLKACALCACAAVRVCITASRYGASVSMGACLCMSVGIDIRSSGSRAIVNMLPYFLLDEHLLLYSALAVVVWTGLRLVRALCLP